ncbi:MAG: sporulation protein YunB [Massiliimalia sp.]
MRRYGRNHLGIKRKLVLLLLVIALFCIYIQFAMGSVVDQVTAHESQILAQQAMNDAFAYALKQQPQNLDDLVTVQSGSESNSQTLSVDSQKVNELRTEITRYMAQSLQEVTVQTLKIPIGSLIGSDLLGARGPDVTFKLYPSGQFTGKMVSQFDAAGINQTRHRLLFQVEVELACVAPFYRSEVQAQGEFLLSETVIVGKVPDYYTQVIGEDTVNLEKAGSYRGLEPSFSTQSRENGLE